MSEHVKRTSRDQTVLFPNIIDPVCGQENPVRFNGTFVDSFNLEKLKFKYSIPAKTERSSYDSSDLPNLHNYGYLNQTRTSRKFESEHRNVKVMLLIKKLAPNHKTIADFRKNNADGLKGVFKVFVYLCRSLDLYQDQPVAIHRFCLSARYLLPHTLLVFWRSLPTVAICSL